MVRIIQSPDGKGIDPDLIDWPSVRTIWLSDLFGPSENPTSFILNVVLFDGTYIDLARSIDAPELRKVANRLSAVHDKPFDDWTRPLHPILTPDEFYLSVLRALLAEDEEVLPIDPTRKTGGLADHCFLNGHDTEAFRETLAGAQARAVLAIFQKETHDPVVVMECADDVSERCRERYRILCDANGKGRERTI